MPSDSPCTAACYRSSGSASDCRCKCGGQLHGRGRPDGGGRYVVTTDENGTNVHDLAKEGDALAVYPGGQEDAELAQEDADRRNAKFDRSLGDPHAGPSSQALTRSVAASYWGTPDSQVKLAPGTYVCSTPSHGGIIVDLDEAEGDGGLDPATVKGAEDSGMVEEVLVHTQAGKRTKCYPASQYQITDEMRSHPHTQVRRVWVAEEDCDASCVLATHPAAAKKWVSKVGAPDAANTTESLQASAREATMRWDDGRIGGGFAANYLVARKRDVTLTYAKPSDDGVRSLRRVRPLAAREAKGGKGYMVAFDHDRGELRSFSVDRIQTWSE